MTRIAIRLCLLLLPFFQAVAEESAATLDALQAEGVAIGNIVLEKHNVFDTSNKEESGWLYQLANRWHIMTRDSVIHSQLLFAEGEPVSARRIRETERLLRQNSFFYDAKITAVKTEEATADLRVTVKDTWTLMPGASITRSGGENRTRFTISEKNLLGTGAALRLNHIEDVDRESNSISYFNRNLFDSWVSLNTMLADNSDGNAYAFNLQRPFYALDTRWSAGIELHDNEREESFYVLGDKAAEYAEESTYYRLFAGWSPGLKGRWVQRWTAGFAFDERRYSPVQNPVLPMLLPESRKLVYPFVAYELLEDSYQQTNNRDQIERTEDFYMGTRFRFSLGYAGKNLDSDRNAWIFDSSISRGFGSISKDALLLSAGVNGRYESGYAVNTRVYARARYYQQVSERSLNYLTFDAQYGKRPDLNQFAQLGGDSGLRGYPLRYQYGHSMMLFTAERRYFTDWYPFRLIRVGAAAFVDVGRTWGRDALGNRSLGWLKDVGIGLRLSPTRASGRDLVHIDLAFPLDGDNSIDDVQLLIQAKQGF